MTEIQFTETFNGFDYEVTQTFVCGSMRTGEKSKYVNRLVIKDGETILLDTFWEGKESEAYLKMKTIDEGSWFIENQDLFTFNPATCEHKLKYRYSRAYKELPKQVTALRIESCAIMSDRCALKTGNYKTESSKKIIFADIVNGFYLNFGYCTKNCPMVKL